MVRKLTLLLAAFALILGGLGPQGTTMVGAAAAMSGEQMSMSDCASMMGMSGSQDGLDCAAMTDEGQDRPMKCGPDDCALRCGPVAAFQITSSFVSCTFPTGMPGLRPDRSDFVSVTGTPPLRPPCSSILA